MEKPVLPSFWTNYFEIPNPSSAPLGFFFSGKNKYYGLGIIEIDFPGELMLKINNLSRKNAYLDVF